MASETTVLGNRKDEHRKEFIEFLGAEAIQIGYVMLAFDGIPAGGCFHWKLDTGDGRACSLDAADYPSINARRGMIHSMIFGT